MRNLFLIACLLAAMAANAADSLRVSLVNFYPGSDIYQLEGHTALRVTSGDYDAAISYGTFDFESPNFVWRFVKGETDYWVAAYPWAPFENSYVREGRRVVEHVIDMDSVQQERFLMLLQNNLLPQNRTYRYNYVKDNCATRPLAMVEAALGDSIVLGEASGATAQARTFRDVMQICHANYPWYQFGIDLALGSGIDYPISNRERSFAPVTLDTQMAGATVGGRPVVKETIVRNEGRDAIFGPTPWYLTPMAAMMLILAIGLVVTAMDVTRLRVTRWFDTAFYGMLGLVGAVIAFLVLVSTHEATSPNWLLLWINPLALIVPIFIWLKKLKCVVLSYQIANFALILVFAIAWPMAGQEGNPAFLPLIVCDALRSLSYIYVNIRARNHPQNTAGQA